MRTFLSEHGRYPATLRHMDKRDKFIAELRDEARRKACHSKPKNGAAGVAT
jgi:hypothetical protein